MRCGSLWQGHAAHNRVTAQINPASVELTAAPAKASDSVPDPVPSDGVPAKISVKAVADVNPLKDAIFYFVGSINQELLFEVHVGKTILNFTSIDLRRFGYYIHQKSGAYVALKKQQHIIYAFSKPRSALTERGGELAEPYRAQLGANLGQPFSGLAVTGAVN